MIPLLLYETETEGRKLRREINEIDIKKWGERLLRIENCPEHEVETLQFTNSKDTLDCIIIRR